MESVQAELSGPLGGRSGPPSPLSCLAPCRAAPARFSLAQKVEMLPCAQLPQHSWFVRASQSQAGPVAAGSLWLPCRSQPASEEEDISAALPDPCQGDACAQGLSSLSLRILQPQHAGPSSGRGAHWQWAQGLSWGTLGTCSTTVPQSGLPLIETHRGHPEETLI